VRGTEPVRTRVVEAGVLKVAARVLKSFLDERERRAAELADQVKQQFKALRAATWQEGNSTNFSILPPVDDLMTVDVVSTQGSLSVPVSRPPSRTSTPGQIASSSNPSRLSGFFAADDAAVSSDGDQEREEDEPSEVAQAHLAALSARGRSRSLIIKSGPNSAEPSSSRQSEDTEMTSDHLESQSQPMDIDDDAETVVAGNRSTAETAHNSPLRTDNLPLSSTFGYPLSATPSTSQANQQSASMSPTPSTSQHSYSLPEDGFRFREEEVLICLQLLAYLSKYPHVRAVFHDPEADYCCSTFAALPQPPIAPSDKSNNIFSLIEKFTVRPAPGDRITPRLPAEIQYWAGVIMRNAYRKDEARGGIRQCANMLCGEWEKFPREFAKCRRCRKAKYCSKSCQSRAWSGGHRYWCSAKDGADGPTETSDDRQKHDNSRTRPRAMTDPTSTNAAQLRAASGLIDIPVPARFNEDDVDHLSFAEAQQDAAVTIAGDADSLMRAVPGIGVEDVM